MIYVFQRLIPYQLIYTERVGWMRAVKMTRIILKATKTSENLNIQTSNNAA